VQHRDRALKNTRGWRDRWLVPGQVFEASRANTVFARLA
jgi:hypothetical protein